MDRDVAPSDYRTNESTSHLALNEDLRRKALDLVYNLDHDESVKVLRQAIAAAPNISGAVIKNENCNKFLYTFAILAC